MPQYLRILNVVVKASDGTLLHSLKTMGNKITYEDTAAILLDKTEDLKLQKGLVHEFMLHRRK